mmetsp:Transcript_22046/g.45957  ORF Transcript_22046/g.45957 Transcript_22046/m.45957 type:complete len:99 (-) Transcript_22046:98-394(-)
MALLRRVLQDHSKDTTNINENSLEHANDINPDIKIFWEMSGTEEGRQHVIDIGGLDTIVCCLVREDCNQSQKDSHMKLLRRVLQDHSKDTSNIHRDWP